MAEQSVTAAANLSRQTTLAMEAVKTAAVTTASVTKMVVTVADVLTKVENDGCYCVGYDSSVCENGGCDGGLRMNCGCGDGG